MFFCHSKSGKLVCICSGPGFPLSPEFLGCLVEFGEEKSQGILLLMPPLQVQWEQCTGGRQQQGAGGAVPSLMGPMQGKRRKKKK